MSKFTLRTLRASVYRYPLEQEVRTSFGTMKDRPAVVVRAEDDSGTVGWGEAWCNFPTVGAEHRARLINDVCAPLLLQHAWPSAVEAYAALTRKLHILALQSAEPGPIAQAIAGVDTALWDLDSRRRDQPLYLALQEHFDGSPGPPVASVPCYASGIHPQEASVRIRQARQSGFERFKVKVGFGADADLQALRNLREEFGEELPLMLDANQRWSLAEAVTQAVQLEAFRPIWLEEPMPADRPAEEWAQLAQATSTPLAAGENLREAALEDAIQGGALRFVQPDLAKWGGLSQGFLSGRQILASGKIYCPHYLGGGLGLLASAHLLAAVGGPGWLEVDCNPNLLREQLAQPFPLTDHGQFALPQHSGLGVTPDLSRLAPYQTL